MNNITRSAGNPPSNSTNDLFWYTNEQIKKGNK